MTSKPSFELDNFPIEERLAAMTYEQALQALEEVVTSLETNKQPLAEALALFERGQLLSRRLADLLDQAELKVRQISGDELADFPSQE